MIVFYISRRMIQNVAIALVKFTDDINSKEHYEAAAKKVTSLFILPT